MNTNVIGLLQFSHPKAQLELKKLIRQHRYYFRKYKQLHLKYTAPIKQVLVLKISWNQKYKVNKNCVHKQ